MFTQLLSCHLLICAAVVLGPVAVVVAFSTLSESGLEEDCKFIFVPYTSRCITPNESIIEVISSRGLAALCSTSLTHTVVNTKNGSVEFSILLPHNTVNEWIYLYALEPLTGEPASCSRNVHGKHSYFQLLEDSVNHTKCSSDQLMKITWIANYLYSGCYLVKADLPSPEPGKNCTSVPLKVHTDFEMEPLAYQNLSVTRKSINASESTIHKEYVLLRAEREERTIQKRISGYHGGEIVLYIVKDGERFVCTGVFNLKTLPISDKLIVILEKELVLNNDCGNPMISSSCITIKLTQERQDLPVVIATVFPNCPVDTLSSNGSFTEHCYWLRQDTDLSLECSCDWKKPQLECTFQDLPVGNYCVQVEALDTRCVRDTVWVNSSLIKKMNNSDPCVWEICNLEIKNETGRYKDEYPKRSPVSWLMVVFAMGAIAAVCVSLYMRAKRNLTQRTHNTVNTIRDDGPCENLIESPQVFLLYARDCLPFMDAMVEFRNLLERTLDVKVFDIWDNRRREDVDASGDTWVINNLSAENTQVVIMATPISQIFENGFLSGDKRGYLAPDSRDDIFLSALHTCIRMTATYSNRCKKFIIARMNCTGCNENILTSFKPLCTIYTLPIHLDSLLSHIHKTRTLHLCVQRFEEPFRRKAEEFEKYVSTNQTYLENIIN